MADPKKKPEASVAGTTPDLTVPSTPPEDSQELSETELTSITGGSMSVGSVAIDDYASTNFLEG
jgi:bacteriocin-like protein